MSNYYKEKNRASRRADHIINETLYIKGEGIDLRLLELEEAPRHNCNFMKVFHERLTLHMEGDKRIKILDGAIYCEEENEYSKR